MRTLNQETLNSMEKYIVDFQRKNGLTPSYRNIMNALSMSSLNLVQRYVLALEKQGKIERTNLGNIKALPQLSRSGATMAPLVGDIACGQPTFAVEQIEESYALPNALFGTGELFMLHTFGDSMIDIGINPGDLIVIRKQNSANDGDIVVAMVDGETTLKRLYHDGKQIILHPENHSMSDIHVKECDIQGVLVSCIKMY